MTLVICQNKFLLMYSKLYLKSILILPFHVKDCNICSITDLWSNIRVGIRLKTTKIIEIQYIVGTHFYPLNSYS